LFSGKMQCATCHEVHSNTVGRPFLRASTTGSDLCLGCHGK
jgi:predicted CXXCH cytochrome family protein